jgi:hypothetical protein
MGILTGKTLWEELGRETGCLSKTRFLHKAGAKMLRSAQHHIGKFCAEVHHRFRYDAFSGRIHFFDKNMLVKILDSLDLYGQYRC